MSKCKHAKRSGHKDYVKCDVDGSRRKKPCHCSHFFPTFWERLKKWFSDRFE